MKALIIFTVHVLFLPYAPYNALYAQTSVLDTNKWHRYENSDGYVLGNGKMYVISGLGKELHRNGKSELSDKKVSLSQISWVIGPSYAIGNLAYGFEINAFCGNDTLKCNREEIVPPSITLPFRKVNIFNNFMDFSFYDVLLPDNPVFIRHIAIRPKKTSTKLLKLFIPVNADMRNAKYGMFDGSEVKGEVIDYWRSACGNNLKPRTSVPAKKLLEVVTNKQTILLHGAERALWQEISTKVPDDDQYAKLFKPRVAATSIKSINKDIKVEADARGFHVDLGNVQVGKTYDLYLYIVTAFDDVNRTGSDAIAELGKWQNKNAQEVIRQSVKQSPPALFTSNSKSGILESINACVNLCKVCQSDQGGIMAQPYMYPMYYIRDQFGSLKLFISQGEYERALNILEFYVAKQNMEGIQNAHDLFGEPGDPTYWAPAANANNGDHQKAEVPSYIILMAKEYYLATNDLAGIIPFYSRLAYNLRVQKLSKNNVLPWAGDESYTNIAQTSPQYWEEMTDSHLLFIAAAKFMSGLATLIGKEKDAAEFDSLYRLTSKSLTERMWLKDKRHLLYSRDEGTQNKDIRPAFDLLLRWDYLEMGTPGDSISQGNLQAVLTNLVNPIRVVPDFKWCAGMDPGYLLYSFSRTQHPLTHDAARLLLKYASSAGLYSEYYAYNGDTIISNGGTLRPWESGINGFALTQYLSGLKINLPEKKINLQPHLPAEMSDWKSKIINLKNEGVISFEINRKGKDVEFTFSRQGGINPLTLDVEFGLFGNELKLSDNMLYFKYNKKNLVGNTIEIAAGNTKHVFKFSVIK